MRRSTRKRPSPPASWPRASPGTGAGPVLSTARGPSVPYACIDIGSNTTRLLVAEPANGRLRELLAQRTFTRLGKGLKPGRAIGEEKLAEVAGVVATQVRLARELHAEDLRAVATAAIRTASDGQRLVEVVRARSGVHVSILTEEQEARLAFLGATRALAHACDGDVAVADVGGSSSELAVGTIDGGVRWFQSFPVGSGFLADAYLRSDPPAVAELQATRQHVEGAFEGLELDPPQLAVAVGGSASSLRRLVGARLEPEALERGLGVLGAIPVDEVARRFELDPERVRLLPAGIMILEAISDRLGAPLQIGNGGLREGVILDMVK
jgi:exopolyphosphatase / guanosine-5'-triphosphate,3'-diphosphate pyrophosphatase